MTIAVRIARPGDGAAIARVWLYTAAYHAELDPEHFKMPVTEDLAERTDEVFGRSGDDVLNPVAEMDGRVIGCCPPAWHHPTRTPPRSPFASMTGRASSWMR